MASFRCLCVQEEASDTLPNKTIDPSKLLGPDSGLVQLWDPSTLQDLGTRKVMGKGEVAAAVGKARAAQAAWKGSSFATRRQLMRTLQRFIVENQQTCARVAVRESGKTLLDAVIGEVLVTCEKLSWLAGSGGCFLCFVPLPVLLPSFDPPLFLDPFPRTFLVV